MSILSTESSLESAFKPPSLVYPSLHKASKPQLPSKYSSSATPQQNDEDQDESANSRNLQFRIHYASRLIKLRSELRSPSYMGRSNSYSNTNTMDAAATSLRRPLADARNWRNSSLYNLSNASATSHPSALSEIGRAQSLPNVLQHTKSRQEEEEEDDDDDDDEEEEEGTEEGDAHSCHYDREDESELCSPSRISSQQLHNTGNSDDEASQLTHLSKLVRASRRYQQEAFHRKSDYLALPPRHRLGHPLNSKTRSMSARDMISEAIDNAAVYSTATAPKPKSLLLRKDPSFTLASQLLYASQSSSQQQQQQKEDRLDRERSSKTETQEETQEEGEEEEEEEEEGEAVMVEDQQLQNSSSTVFDEKVEIFTSPLSPVTDGVVCCKCNCAPTIIPQPTLSRDNKSLFSAISSDSDDEEMEKEDDCLSIHSFNRRIIQKRRQQKQPQAFLVSLSPSSAAAASVARSRRTKHKIIRIQSSKGFCSLSK